MLWLNAALNSILVAPELAFPWGMMRIVQEETRRANRLSVPTCVTFSEDRQGRLLPAGHPLLGFPRALPGWWTEAAPVRLVYAALPWGREDHQDSAVFLSRDTACILARAMLYLTTWDCPPLQGIYSRSHIPSNASHSYYENQNHPQAFPKAPRVAALSPIENHGSIHRWGSSL